MKRYISLLLTAAMLLSLLIVPASAEGTPEMELQVLSFTENLGAIVEGQPLNSAKPEDLLAVKVLFNNKTENTINFGGYAIQIEYDKDLFTPYSYNYEEEGFTSTAGPIIYSKLIQRFANESNAKKEGLCEWTGGIASPLPIDTNKTLVLGYALFKVKADVESTTTEFKFSNNSEKNFIASSKPEQGGVSDVDYVPGVSFDAAASLTINGVAPTLGKVTVTDKDNNTVLDTLNSELKFGTLEVNGTTNYTYQAHAWSTSGKEITGNVTWKFKVGNELCTEFRGATIDETTGQIFIPKDASTDVSGTTFAMSVVAQAKEGVTAEKDIETSLIQVRREEYRIAKIQISRKDGETGALIIPGTGEAAATAEFVATCTNQYGKPYTGNKTIYWNYGRKDTNEGVSGITMNGAVLSVSSDAKNVENGSIVLAVTATTGSGIEKVTSNEVEITVQRDTVQRPAKIVISGGPEGSTLAVPKTGTATATYTATVKDQYGAEMSGQTVTWSVVDGNGYAQNPVGVNLNESTGALTVTSAAAGNTFAPPEGTKKIYYIQATCGSASDTTTLTLTREAATVTTLKITGSDTLEVPTKSEYPYGQITPYPVTIYDQYGVEMNSDDYSFGRELETTGVSDVIFQPAGVKVTCYAAGNQFDQNNTLTFTIKASCLGKEATKTITLKREPSAATAITYNDTVITVVPTDDAQVPTKAAPAVEDQYGLLMNNATVESDGALPTGIVLEKGELYITKAAKTHFGGERQDEVQVSVSLKCGESVQNTVKLKLTLAAAQINKDSAEITGSANIAKPTGEQANTAVYSISDVIKDQYGLPMEIDRSKLSLKLYHDKECGSEANGSGDPVQLSGPNQSGQWTVTVTKDATLDKTYYLKASYQVGNDSHMQCAPVKEITIVDKTVSNTLTVTQGNFTYGEEGKLNPVVKKDGETITNAAFVYTKGGQTVTEVKDTGKYTVTATCEDATHIYTGSVDFQILPKEIKVDWIELDGTRYTYNGREQTVKYTVKDGNTTLVKDRDYTVEGDKQTNAGVHLLKIIGKDNYTSDPTGASSVNWSIWALPVRINTATFQSRAYAKDNYSAVLDTLTLVAAEDGVTMPDTLTAGNGFTVSDIRVTNNNAGQQPVSFKVTLTNTNYKWKNETGNIFNVSESAGYKVTISKIDHRAEAVSAEGKYGSTVRVPLAEYLPDGWSVQQSAISVDSNGNGNVHKSFRLEDTTLVVELNNNEALVGKYVKITLPVASTNYNPFTITVTVTAQKKETQTVTANDLNVTYGDAGVKLNASALDNAQLTYQVTEGADVVTVDTNGNVTLRKSGTAKIQITAAETEDYGTANTTVTVTVAKRSLTVKANDLTAYVGGQLPALDYTVTGLVSGDTLTTVPELELKDVPAGVDPMKTAGTYTIGFKTAPVADPDKYDLTVETGTLTVSSRPNVNPVPAGNSVKLEEAAGGKLTSSVSRATKGTTVTITVKPDAGYQLEELEVLDKNGEALPLKELANGKFSFQMPDSKVTVQASFVQESTYAGYPDVLPQDWFYSSVRYVTERGLMNGTPNGFEPNMDSSRATIWTILARFSGVDTTVVSGEWYAVARQWAMENGVSDGTNPNGVITREQLATMLYRFAKNKGLVQEPVTADLSVFVDAGQISDYALDAMRWAVSVGLLNGMDGSRLAPQGSAARAQVAAMLMRFDQLAK